MGVRFSHRTVGLAGVAGVVLIGLLVALISAVPLGVHHYHAIVAQSAGLTAGEEVRVAGITMGKVTAVELDGRHVRVDFTVKKSVHLGSETRASIDVATLLGTHMLTVEPTSSGHLKDDTIALSHTSVPYNLQDVIAGTSSSLGAFDDDTLTQTMSVLSTTLDQTSASAAKALDGVSRLSAVAASRAEEMKALMASSSAVVADLNRNSAQVMHLLSQSTLILDELTKRRDAIHETLTQTQTLAAQLSGVVKDNDKAFGPMLDRYNSLVGELRKNEDAVDSSISGLRTMATYFANAIGNGPWLPTKVRTLVPDSVTGALAGAGTGATP